MGERKVGRGIVLGLGIVLLIGGALGIVVGLAVAIIGPDAASDAGGGSNSGSGDPLSAIRGGGEADEERRTAETRNEVRAVGGAIALAGVAVAVLGGVLYAIGRGMQAAAPSSG